MNRLRKNDTRQHITKIAQLCCLSAANVLIAGHAQAQSNSDQALEEIIVTARLRLENVQDVPISISTLTGDALDARGIQDLSQASTFVPNLTFDAGSGRGAGATAASIFIRGVGQTDWVITTDPGVGLYIDGVYYGHSMGSVLDALDLERIEVLRGPQGTLFGRNTIGGAINIQSRMPGDVFEGYIEGQIGSFNERNVRGAASLPLSETVSVRISASSRQRDGWVKSLARTGQVGSTVVRAGGDGLELNDINDFAARGVLQWEPTNRLTSTFIVDTSRQRRNGFGTNVIAVNESGALVQQFNRDAAPTLPFPPLSNAAYVTDIEHNYATTTRYGDPLSDLDVLGLSATFRYELSDDLAFTSITAHRSLDSHAINDIEGTPFDWQSSDISEEIDQVSQEFRLNGAALSGRIDYVTGLYYYTEDIRQYSLISLLYPYYQLTGTLDISSEAEILGENVAWAAYGDATFGITDALSVSVGVRYTAEDKDVDGWSLHPDSGRIILPVGSNLSPSFDAVTPRLGLEYRFRPNALTYVTVTEGYKSGGVNGSIFSRAGDFSTYKAEEQTTYEVGLKTDWLDDRLRVNAAFFRSDYTNIQQKATLQQGQAGCPNVCRMVLNDVETEFNGLEVEITARPVPWFAVDAGFGYLDQKFTYIAPIFIQQGVLDYDRHHPKAPKSTISIGAQYERQLSGNRLLTARLDYARRSRTYHTIENDPFTTQPPYSLLNARISLINLQRGWELALIGRNLTNERYIVSPNDAFSTGISSAVHGAPRTYTLSLRYSFGE